MTDAFSLRRTGITSGSRAGLEPEVIEEAHLDQASIFAGIQRFAQARDERLGRQRALLEALK